MQKGGHTQTTELQLNCKTCILQRKKRKRWKHKEEENTLLKRRILQQLNNAHKIPRTSTHYGSQEIRSDWKEKGKALCCNAAETCPRRGASKWVTGTSAGLGLPVPTGALLPEKLSRAAPPTQGTSFTRRITGPSAPTDSNYHLAVQRPAAWQQERTDPSALKR